VSDAELNSASNDPSFVGITLEKYRGVGQSILQANPWEKYHLFGKVYF
jgi:hypothetical protein